MIEKSEASLYASSATSEMIAALQNIKDDFLKTGSFDQEKLAYLLAPTGPIQEISIDNGWREKFLQVAQEIDLLSSQLSRKEPMSNEQQDPEPEKPADQTGTWLAIGIAMGIAIGAALDNIGLGIAIGAAIGISMGYAQTQKNKKE